MDRPIFGHGPGYITITKVGSAVAHNTFIDYLRPIRQSFKHRSSLSGMPLPLFVRKQSRMKIFKTSCRMNTTFSSKPNVGVIAICRRNGTSSYRSVLWEKAAKENEQYADGNMSKEEFIRQRDAYRVQEDDKMEQIQRLRTEKDQIFLPVRKDADNLQTVVSAAEEAGDVMHLSQNVVETFIDRIEVFNDECVKIRFTFEDVLKSYEAE